LRTLSVPVFDVVGRTVECEATLRETGEGVEGKNARRKSPVWNVLRDIMFRKGV
jgi:hypothetical protein